jgi:CheY-like chemotaxis protein
MERGVVEGVTMQLLIAHQDPAVRASIAKAVEECDHEDGRGVTEVLESADAQQVLDLLLAEEPPRLAVVDWDLPGLDGPELCRLVRDFRLGGPPYIVVLAASGYADVSVVLEAGANDFIRVPAPAAEIRERLAAGMNFVAVPRETRDRAAMLEAVLTQDSKADGSACFDALETLDSPNSLDAPDALDAPDSPRPAAPRKAAAELTAVLV